MTTPRELGYRMPAEWEPHAATWLSWPHNERSWPGKLGAIPPVFAKMVAALAASETVHINVNDAGMERDAKQHLKQAGARGEIHFHHFPTNDAWCRDHGAIFVVRDRDLAEEGAENENDSSPLPPGEGPGVKAREQAAHPAPPLHPPCGHLLPQGGEGIEERPTNAAKQLAATNWRYNAWGEKYPHDLDNEIPRQMAAELGVPVFDVDMVLEGGSIDVNGAGLLMTTESCLLNKNRNPALSRDQIEQTLAAHLGVDEFLWLGDGIEGDDTDGHIDDLARFVAEETVVTAIEPNRDDVNHGPLRENLAALKRFHTRAGRPLNVVELPMPPAVVWEGQRLPATYANFYIANHVVLLPGYNKRIDEIARGILQEQFRTREVVVIDCTEMIWGFGAFHCLTQQVPAV